jgi:hypothetical protein
MASLAEIRAKLLEAENKTQQKSSTGGGDNAIFPHWNIKEGDTATLRFLPDADENNTFFWKERQMIRIEFPGVKGGDEHKPVTVQVPCVEMWGESCPVHAEIRPWFKDPSLEDTARKYWKKRSYLFQGFVTDNPLDEEAPENPIRRFVISPQIFKIISTALMDPDFPEIPTDYEQGTDFKVIKGSKGQYADYGTSNWARRERSLNQQERDAIAAHGLFNLDDFLPKRPDAAALNAIFEMFEASVDGQLYDPERFADYYRPYGVEAPNSGSRPQVQPAPAAPAPAPQPAAPVQETVNDTGWQDPAPAPAPAPAAATASDDGKPSAADILSAIRNRKQ